LPDIRRQQLTMYLWINRVLSTFEKWVETSFSDFLSESESLLILLKEFLKNVQSEFPSKVKEIQRLIEVKVSDCICATSKYAPMMIKLTKKMSS
jgi:hypothetical protein